MLRIPIHLRPNGNARHNKAPVVRLALLHFPAGQPIPAQVRGFNVVEALIDTGASLNVADPSVLDPTGAPAHASMTISGVTGETRTTAHQADLLFPEIESLVRMEFVRSDLIGTGRRYPIILGRQFLELGRLVMDYPANEFYFEKPAGAPRD